MDPFDDVFHNYGDDVDEKEDDTLDWNAIRMNINKDDELQVDAIDPIVQEEEQRLSQKLSQLSTTTEEQVTTTKKRPSLTPTTPTTDTVSTKKVKTNRDEESLDEVPYYLSHKQGTFDLMVMPIIQKKANSINIEQLRQLAHLLHKLSIIDLNISLWTTYLRAGKVSIWPDEVRTTVMAGDVEQNTGLDYVNTMLRRFRDQTSQVQAELKEKKEQLQHNFPGELEDAVVKFVEQNGIVLHRMRTEGKIIIVEHDYIDQSLEREFKREKPNDYQMNIFQQLTLLKYEKEKAKCQVAISKQRIVHNQLPDTLDPLQVPPPSTLTTIQDEHIRQRLMDRYQKLMERTKSDMMIIQIAGEEAKLNEHRTRFDLEMSQMNELQRSGPSNKKLTRVMMDVLDRRSDDQEAELIHRRSIHSNSIHLGCSPTLILDTTHHLSSEQLNFLHRGPTYVSPCQVHTLSSSSLTIDQILHQQIAPLRRQLTKVFTKYPVDLSRRMNFEKEIQQLFRDSFAKPIPQQLEERALYEKKLIRSIHSRLNKDHLILRRTADDKNVYYLGRLNDFNQKADDYVEQSKYYEMVKEQHLADIVKTIDSELELLCQRKVLNKDHLSKLSIGKKTNLQLPSLYFLPQLEKNGQISLEPRLSSCTQCPISALANYLDQLLRPLFDQYSRSTTFNSGGDFIQRLQHYCIQNNALLPTTRFATFKIDHLFSRVSHADILTGLHKFLGHAVVTRRHHNLTNDAIEELTGLFLRHNIFSYHGRIFRYIQGCPMNISLTRLLCNIYLYYWQLPLLRQIRLEDELYGRYDEMGFLTWNGPIDTLQMAFNELKRQQPDIQLITSISSGVHFLDAYVQNRNGSLYTSVYHDSTEQRHLLPYAVGHPRLAHRQWFQLALLRAGQYCSSFEDFEDERLYIELTFLANGYSIEFVNDHLVQFFKRYNPVRQQTNLNQFIYASLRRQLFRSLSQQQQRSGVDDQFIHLQYLFDWGSRVEFNRKFYELWRHYLEQDPTFKKYGLKIRLSSLHCYSSNALLAVPKDNRLGMAETTN